MKKLLLILPILIVSSYIFPTGYLSNVLGQKIEESDFCNSQYYLMEEEKLEKLYRDGVLISTTEVCNEENISTVYNKAADGSQTIRKYRNGLLISEEIIKDGVCSITNYTYSDDSLAFCSFCSDKNKDEWNVTYFIRSSNDGSLIGVRTGDELYLYGDDYILTGDGLLKEAVSGMYVENDFEVNEDGHISFTADETTYIYGTDGRLLGTENDGTVTTYEYDGEELIGTTAVKDTTKTASEYENGVLLRRIVTDNDTVISETTYNDGIMIQIIYSNGIPLAKITYREDNMHVESIEYLGD